MKALVYAAPCEVVYRDEPDPRPGAGDVLIRVDAVGICGSDMHAYHGRDPRRVPPLVLGHELAGEILEGPGRGKLVTVNPIIACGHCDYCVQGRDNLCANRTMIGMQRPGGFAERVITAERAVIELPDGMDARTGALTEPAATALHAIDVAARTLARPLPECAVLVIGGGAIGLLAALLLRSYGVRRVWLAETNPLRRDAARRAVAVDAFDPHARGGPAENGVDLVLDAVGAAPTRQAALAAVKPGGVVVHVGLADWASEIDMRKLTLAEIALVGTYTYTTADLRAAARALHDGAFGDLAWVEERPLAEGARAFDDLHRGVSGAAKILLRP
ncbi:MAG: alcohol dehydrogenase catalytic domain-containing protein [Betaproteobacteria bacterium]|nr:alcohol dehydrogenase catalytic domain-containing protein [Betaproteobacteria bacterium]MCC7215383.1 alcohol dehydrogenase catalytic domain-containing protein [Burkholderiales bacterium]